MLAVLAHGLTTLAGDLALFLRVHCRKAALAAPAAITLVASTAAATLVAALASASSASIRFQ
jgi:hypothetical protein